MYILGGLWSISRAFDDGPLNVLSWSKFGLMEFGPFKKEKEGEMAERSIVSMLEETRVFEPPEELKRKAHIKSMEEYREIYQRSLQDPEGFWEELAEQLDWYRKWDKVLEWDFEKPEIKWFIGGKLNASYNCLDRHLKTWRRNKAALIWQGEPLEENRVFTYQPVSYTHLTLPTKA